VLRVVRVNHCARARRLARSWISVRGRSSRNGDGSLPAVSPASITRRGPTGDSTRPRPEKGGRDGARNRELRNEPVIASRTAERTASVVARNSFRARVHVVPESRPHIRRPERNEFRSTKTEHGPRRSTARLCRPHPGARDRNPSCAIHLGSARKVVLPHFR
jgi:hypothetical protein